MQRNILVLLILMLSFWPAYAETAPKVGVVDGEKLFDEYPAAQEATKKIADAQDELRDAISETEKVYSEFEKQKKSEAEKLTKKKELQSKIDAKAQETKKMIESLSAKIEEDILTSIKKVAGEKTLDVVFDKRAVLVGGADITDAVSTELRKKAPIAESTSEQSDTLETKKTIKKTN